MTGNCGATTVPKCAGILSARAARKEQRNSREQLEIHLNVIMSAPSCSTSCSSAQCWQHTANSRRCSALPQLSACSRRLARRERKALRTACAAGLGPDVVHFVQHWSQVLARASPAPLRPALSVLTTDIASTISFHPTTMGLARLAVRILE